MNLASPRPLSAEDDLSHFESGEPSLDDWLRRRARANQASGASRTYVVCQDNRAVVAYYALASGAVDLEQATGRLRRNTPDPVPVVVLGRLAIDRRHQGKGLGRALVKDASLRILQAAETIGVRGVLVHALSAEAAAFYRAAGFEASPLDPATLMATLADLRGALD